MAVDLGLRGAAQRLREGTWYETAAQVERAADEIARLTADVEGLKALNAAYHASVGKVCSQRDRETIRAEKAEAQRDALLAACELALVYLRDSEDVAWMPYTEAWARVTGELRAAIASTLATTQTEGPR